jgi:DNA-binding transcriptional LysR family regulator
VRQRACSSPSRPCLAACSTSSVSWAVELLVRVPRGVELTDAGHEIFERAHTVLEGVEDILTIARPAEPTGPLLLGLSVAGFDQHWHDLATAFADNHRGIDVEIHSALSELLQRQVLAGALDVAIVLEPTHHAGLRYEVLREDPVLAWMHAEHLLTGRPHVTPAEVATHPVTLVGGPAGRGSGFNAAVRRIFADAGCTPEFREPLDPIPFTAIHDPGAVLLSVCGYAGQVAGIPLTGDHTMSYELVRRAAAATEPSAPSGSSPRVMRGTHDAALTRIGPARGPLIPSSQRHPALTPSASP